MPGTVITFPVRGAGVVILSTLGLFGGKPPSQGDDHYGLGVARAGQEATGGGHVGAGEPAGTLLASGLLRPSILHISFQIWGGHI